VKRWVVLSLLALVGAAAVASFAALRSEWGGARLCGLAGRLVERGTGLALEAGSCRLDPLRLEVHATALRLGPPAAPVLEADAVRVRLAPLQALGGRVHLAAVEIRRPRLRADLRGRPPAAGPAACPPAALARLEVRSLLVEDASVDLVLPSGARLAVDRADVRADPPRSRAWPGAPAPRSRFDVRVEGASWRDGARGARASSARASGELALDLSRLVLAEAAVEGDGWSASASGTAADLCQPRLDLAVSARAPLATLAALAGHAGDVAGAAEARLAVAGTLGAPTIAGDVRLAGARIGRWVPGDARARVALRGSELRVEDLEVPGRSGQVRARATVRLGGTPRLEAEADLADVELAEVLERTGLPGAWVLLRVTGKVKVGGTLSPLALDGEGALDLADFKALTHRWETFRPPEQAVLEIPAARVEAGLRVSRESVRIEGGHLRVGAETARVDAELFLSSARGFVVRVDGGADLSALRRVSSVPIGGRARLRGTVHAAPYGNPRIEAEVRTSELRFLQLDLGELAGQVTYGPHDHVVRARALDGRKGETRYSGSAAVDLAASPPAVQDLQVSATGRLRDLFDAVLPWLPGTRAVRDALDGAIEARASARGPATALDAEFAGRLGPGTVLGRAFDGGALEGRIEAGARAHFRRAELRRRGGAARAAGRWELRAPNAWDLDLDWERLPLGEALGAAEGWAGTTDGAATFAGSLERPDVRFTASAAGAAVGGVPLRDARAEGRLRGEQLALEATAEGMRLGATARARGDGPFEAHVDLAHDDLARLFRPEARPGVQLRVRGTARAEGTIADVAGARADVRLERLEASYSDFRVANEAPVSLQLAARRLEIRPFGLRGTNTALTVSGAVAPGGALAIDARGTLDLRVLGDAVPRVSTPQGLIALEARVGGTVSSPLLVGSGRLSGGGFAFRDAPIAFSGLGGDLAFSHNRVLFDRLEGAVNGGRAELAGEVELEKLFPERLRVRATLDEVPLRIPEWLPSTVSGPLRVEGAWSAMLLAGRLRVVRARYTEAFDLERSMLEFRRRATVARAYDPSGEWLSFDVALVVDGDARVENDVVRGAVRGEVLLTGTLGAPGLVGALSMTPGSRATFRGNEFALSHAVLDFTDRRGVRMHLDVHGETQVQEYQVFMHLYGPWETPQLQLTSQPALTQEDLVALLSLGFTTRDAALTGAAGGVATAAAAQALFSVSGLDAQVRRFMPAGGPLRDFTVRMTSAYSQGTGEVEPRAELESKLLDDRLRLRWQTTISGAGGQRAQAELKLGGRASVQYQWESDNADVATGGDHGLDLKLRWEWND
jgi:translocation and assembly module TamB